MIKTVDHGSVVFSLLEDGSVAFWTRKKLKKYRRWERESAQRKEMVESGSMLPEDVPLAPMPTLRLAPSMVDSLILKKLEGPPGPQGSTGPAGVMGRPGRDADGLDGLP